MNAWRTDLENAGIDNPVLVWDGEWQSVASQTPQGKWFIHNSYGFNEDGQIYDVTHWKPLDPPPGSLP